MTDASRAVGVASNLLSEEKSGDYKAEIRADYEAMAEAHARGRAEDKRTPIGEARENAWAPVKSTSPSSRNSPAQRFLTIMIWPNCATILTGRPSSQSWDLHGRYPAILTDDVVGEAATNLFNDAQAIDQMIEEKWLTAKGLSGFGRRAPWR